MTDVEQQILLKTICLPAAVTAIGLAATTIAGSRWPWARAPLMTLTLAVAFGATEIAIRGWQGYWPADVTRRLPHVALLVVAISLLRARLPFRPLAMLLSIVLAGVVSGGFAQSGATAEFTSSERAVWWIGLGVLFLVSQVSLEQIAARRTAGSLVFLWAGCVGASAGLLAASGSLAMGQVCGVLAVCLTVVMLFAWRSPSLSLQAGPAELTAVLFGALVVAGSLFSELPRGSATLMTLAPHAAWLASVRWFANRPWRARIATTLIAFGLLGTAAGMAIANRSAPAEVNPYDY